MHTPHYQSAWKLFWCLIAFFFVTASGHFYSPDEEALFLVSKAMVDRQSVDIAPYPDYLTSIRIPGVNEGKYASYGIVPSLLAAPVYAVTKAITPGNILAQYDLSHFLMTLINIPFAAGIAVLLAILLVNQGVSQRASTFIAVACVLGLLWPYTRSFFSETSATFWLLASVFALMRAQDKPHLTRGRFLWLGVSGAALSLLVNTRVVSGVVAPLLLLALIAWHPKPAVWRDVVAWGIGGIPGLGLFVWYNMARFGEPLATGYGSQHDRAFDTVIWDGLYGLLLSLQRGIIWYVPFVLLLPLGAWIFYKQQHWRALALYSALILAHLIVYARVWFWDGGGVWGPRYLVITTPFIYLISAAAWHSHRRWVKPVATTLLVLTIAINTLGVLVNFATYTNLATPHPSPIVAHAELLVTRIRQAWPATQTCYLRTGWYEREQPDQALFRRSEAQATITCTIDQPTVIKLTLDDRRPESAPRSDATITLDGETYDIREGMLHTLEWLPRTGTHHTIVITNNPWNPREIGFGNRNQDIGPTLLFLRSGVTTIAVNDTTVLGMPEQYGLRWTWYYDPLNQHLLDWWPTYVTHTALSPYRKALFWMWGIGCVFLLIIAWLPIPRWIRRSIKTGPLAETGVSHTAD